MKRTADDHSNYNTRTKRARVFGNEVGCLLFHANTPLQVESAFNAWVLRPLLADEDLTNLRTNLCTLEKVVGRAVREREIKLATLSLVEALSLHSPTSDDIETMREDVATALSNVPVHLSGVVDIIAADPVIEDLPSLIVLLDNLIEAKSNSSDWRTLRTRAVAKLIARQREEHGDAGVQIAFTALHHLRETAEVPDEEGVLALLADWSDSVDPRPHEVEMKRLIDADPALTVSGVLASYQACVSDLRGRVSAIVKRVQEAEEISHS